MEDSLAEKLLFRQLQCKPNIDITVTGVSMNPTLTEGDRITVSRQEAYVPGDILVFRYKNNELLVHRLLKNENERFFCKGDNSLRLEDITCEQIAGKVTHINGNEICPCPPELIRLSYLVNRQFKKEKYNHIATRSSGIYRFYHHYMYKEGISDMLYKKNTNMDFIQSDETTLAVYDPDTGDTHLFDETGIDILNCLDQPCSTEQLLDQLCQIYNVTKEDIEDDIQNFLTEVVSKKVVEVICE